MISMIVARSDPVIRDWEIWNEPDTGELFSGTPEQYAFMLRAAYDAIKGVDQQADVLLGGISSTAGMSWLAQVFSIPGADAAHAFDIANVHERADLGSLAGDISSWKRFFESYGFTGPLWVTEHGYPSDPAFQRDPPYAGGAGSQASYLTASIPTLLDAGAGEVFVTERDNLGGQFASEGVLGGDVSDPPVAEPEVIEKPAYGAVQALGDCYMELGRDCPGPEPVATPASLSMAATALRSARVSTILVSDLGTEPLALGSATLVAQTRVPIKVSRDGCSNQILEPDRACTLAVRFAPVSGGAVIATLQLPSDNGTLQVPVTAVSPSVSSLTARNLLSPVFKPTRRGDGVGYTQRLVLELTNPLRVPVQVASAGLSSREARRFKITTDRCSGSQLMPGARCRLSVLFTPRRAGTARALLTLRGVGTPLAVALDATAFAVPSVMALSSTAHNHRCVARAPVGRVVIAVDQPSAVSWVLTRPGQVPHDLCGGQAALALIRRPRGKSLARGRTPTSALRILIYGRREYVARVVLSTRPAPRDLTAGTYLLTVTATNSHGTSRAKSTWVTIP
jgi:hypothetical protein